MRFSIWPNANTEWTKNRDFVVACEKTGWQGVWFEDHLIPMMTKSGPLYEVWSVIAGFAEATEKMRLGTLVCSLTYRHPAILASAALTCDHISGGRMVLGIGAGWQEPEHQAYGIELGTKRQRSDRLAEGAEVIRSLLNDETTTFDGSYFSITNAPREPKGFSGRLPLLIAGKGEQRTLPTAARFADIWNGWVTPAEMVAKRKVLASECEKVGRELSELECSTQAVVGTHLTESEAKKLEVRLKGRPVLWGSEEKMRDYIGELAEAGTSEFILADWAISDPEARLDIYEHMLTNVIGAL